MKAPILILVLFLCSSNAVMADALNDMFTEYKKNGVTQFNEKAGEAIWKKQFKNNKTGKLRSCNTCHGTNLSKVGKHAKTGKIIQPMAPSVNPKRLTKVRTIKKWLLRNCKWTLGRECSIQERADILTYLKNQ